MTPIDSRTDLVSDRTSRVTGVTTSTDRLSCGVVHNSGVLVSGKIRHEVGKRIVLKRIPALKFEFDEALSQGYRINEIIDSLEMADDQRED